MNNTVYNYFDTYNYTGTLATSSYALPFAEFTFVPQLDNTITSQFSDKRIIWNFGDGTIVESVTATHAYSSPGSYEVTSALYDEAGNSYLNTFYQTVDVYDFIPSNISISVDNTQEYVLTASRINSPIYVTNSLSYNVLSNTSDNKSIVPFCSGSNNDYFYQDIINKPYGHLYSFSSFYLFASGSNNTTEFVEISSFKTIATPLYCKLSSSEIIFTDSSDTEAFFCGLTGYNTVYFKNDNTFNQLNLLFGYESGSLKNYNNTSTVGLCAKVVPNTSFDRLDISSNGITSEGNTSDLFPIGKNKFANTKVGFVVKFKDSLNFSNKSTGLLISQEYPRIPITTELSDPLLTENDFILVIESPLNIVLTDGTTVYDNVTFYSNYKNIETLQYGSLKGYFIADLPLTTNVFISATYKDQLSGSNTISGTSNTFNIYPKDYYNITKKGEDVDMTQQFKDIAFQPLFLDSPVLFNDFLGSMVGNLSSKVGDTLGKRTYEKIQNFTDNTNAIDYANIQSVAGMLQSTGNTNIQFSKSNYLYPSEIGRLIDLLSINFNRLRGASETFNQDFKTFGYQDRETYGKNLGNEVSTFTYTVTAGTNLVAFERYSGKFTLLNTTIPLCASSVSTFAQGSSVCYKLSSYNDTWGWGLVLPGDFTVYDIASNYFFYEHIETIADVNKNSIINYDDVTLSLNTPLTSYVEWSQPEGIISNILSNQLYTGLNLFS